jgi:DNA-binding response OmpR family regulator
MSTKRIIIVDDTMSVGRLVESTLTTLGANLAITVVPSAEEALLESGLYHVDLIVTDYHLPGISGLELANQVRERSPETTVILMSGVDDTTLGSQAIEAGAVDFFAKPLDLERFMAKTRQILSMTGDNQTEIDQVEAQTETSETTTDPLPGPAASLSDILGDLRSRLGSHSVLLLGEDGRIVAQAGDLPHIDFESMWVSPLMTMVSHSNRASYLVGGASATTITTFRGEEIDLLLAPVGAFGLVITLDTGGGENTLFSAAMDETMAAQQELASLLENMGIRIQASKAADESAPVGFSQVDPTVPDETASRIITDELSTLFEGESKVSDDADAFWDELNTSGSKSITNPDALSYEEARKLGLAPDDPD